MPEPRDSNTFPAFRVWLASGRTLTEAEFGGSSLTYLSAIGQSNEYNLTIVGENAKALFSSGELAAGLSMREVWAGYSDKLELVGRNLLIWENSFSNDGENGSTLTVTAYGCSQYLRESGARTVKLKATTYADAAREVAARWGLEIKIGTGAYRDIPEPVSSSDPGTADTPKPATPADNPANKAVVGAGILVAEGLKTPSLTSDSLHTSGYCAQFVRQVVEHGLGIRPGTWAVYKNALVEAHDDHRKATYATDYEAAAREMGLAHDGPPVPGDILFRSDVSLPYGHTAIFVGTLFGMPSVIENTDVARGIPVYGSGPIRLTPLDSFGTPTTIAHPKKAPATQETSTNALAGLAKGVTGTAIGPSAAASATRKGIYQENESDYDFLARIGRQIGYIVAETPLGDSLFFGPGVESSQSEAHLLVQGDYTAQSKGQNPSKVAANISSLRSNQSFYGLPAEIVVTGFERGKRFSLVVTPDDLAENHKLGSPQGPADPQTNTDALDGLAGEGVTGTVAVNSAGQTYDKKTGRFVRTKAKAGDFAGKRVAELLTADGMTKRFVLGGASSKLDALERGLEALALENLRYQTVELDTFGIPTIKSGDLAILEGDEVPRPLKGLYLITSVNGTVSGEGGFGMALTLNRNTV